MNLMQRSRKEYRKRLSILSLKPRYSEKNVADALRMTRKNVEHPIPKGTSHDAAYMLGYQRALMRFRRTLNVITEERDYGEA